MPPHLLVAGVKSGEVTHVDTEVWWGEPFQPSMCALWISEVSSCLYFGEWFYHPRLRVLEVIRNSCWTDQGGLFTSEAGRVPRASLLVSFDGIFLCFYRLSKSLLLNFCSFLKELQKEGMIIILLIKQRLKGVWLPRECTFQISCFWRCG